MKCLGAAGLACWVVLLGCLLTQLSFAEDSAGTGTLVVVVPEDATVEVNGKLTHAKGSRREFVDRGLQPGYDYEYVVRVKVVREGRTVEQVKTVRLQAGQTLEVSFTFPASPEAKGKEPTLAPKQKDKTPTWQPKEKAGTSGPPSKESSTKVQIALPPSKESPGTTPLVGPDTGAGKKINTKPVEKPGTSTPDKKGSELPGPKKPAKPIVHKIPMVEQYLVEGKLANAEADLAERLRQNPRDDETRASLGTVQFFHAVERLSQSLYRHGFWTPDVDIGGLNLKVLRLPVRRNNPKPDPLSYLQAEEIVKDFVLDLDKAEKTLEGVDDRDIKVPLHVGLVRLDLTGDGQDRYPLWWLYAALSGRSTLRESDAKTYLVCFDYGDVLWLRGYCKLLMGIGEIVLAYDERDVFEQAGNLLFAKPVGPGPFLVPDPEKLHGRLDNGLVVSLENMVKLKLDQPERMVAAAKDLRAALDLSAQSWKAILAETDDDFEWIPNPKQRGAIPNLIVNQRMVEAWLKSIDEAGAVLAGTKLAPRLVGAQPGGNQGVNVSRVFSQPPGTFDLIRWLHGNGSEEYLENGTLTDPKVWRGLQDVFGRDLLNYLLWFN